MSTFLYPIGPIVVLSPSRGRSTVNTFLQGTHFGIQRSSGKDFGIARLGLGEVPFLDPENSEMVVKNMFGRLEGFLCTLADAAVTSADTLDGASTAKQDGDWLSGIANSMELVLKVLKDVLSTLHVPYAYGFAIILLTIIVKGATFPLTKKQVESAMAMQTLTPQIKAIQQRYAGDQERIQLETARLYKLSGINPLAGCLPTLLTIPIWIGLYRALSNVANEGLLNEGFFWIPSLSGPTTIADRQTGSGTSWLFPFIDGHPPLGWPDTFAYLVLPLLLVLSQYISIQIMQPPQSDDPNVKNSQAITKFLPLMIGYFSLSVPSGLSLYWFTNNILSTAQQVWLRKMRGAKNPVMNSSNDILSQDQFKVTKQIPEAPYSVNQVAEKSGEASPDVPRRGERFKQLKEQEAQRRKLREEQSKKTEDSTAKGSQITSDTQAANRVDKVPVNGNGSLIELEANEDARSAVNKGNNPRIADDKENGINDLHLDKNVD